MCANRITTPLGYRLRTLSLPTVPPPSNAWGPSATGAAVASGVFFCESPVYENYAPAANWSTPALAEGPDQAGLAPTAHLNKLCAYFNDQVATLGPSFLGAPSAAVNQVLGSIWFGNNSECGLFCLGTGAIAPANQAVVESDRYALLFQSLWTYPNGNQIKGVFVHTKNTYADPGTQVAALCVQYPDHLVFGDLNVNLHEPLKRQSLVASIAATHTILSIEQAGGNNYFTRYNANNASTSTLDFVCIPNAVAPHVELWAYRPGAAANLERNGNNSDHSVMMLRVRCV